MGLMVGDFYVPVVVTSQLSVDTVRAKLQHYVIILLLHQMVVLCNRIEVS